jgi:hypothetical protein
MSTPLEQAVIRTLAWFSLTKYPVTVFEIWKWMIEPVRSYELSEIYRVLHESEWLAQKIQSSGGHYALKGTPPICEQVKERRARFVDAVRKFGLLKRVLPFIQIVPGVQSVGAVNTLSWWFTSRESDIDLYVITRPNHIWLSRLLLVAPFALSKKRPHTGVQDPFCFSFFSTPNALQMETIKLERDYYLAFWCRSIVPLIDHRGDFRQFQQENRWVDQMLPHAYSRSIHPYQQARYRLAFPFSFQLFNAPSRVIQHRRLPKALKEMANIDSRVVLSDEMLKFHQNDRRKLYRDQFDSLLERHL